MIMNLRMDLRFKLYSLGSQVGDRRNITWSLHDEDGDTAAAGGGGGRGRCGLGPGLHAQWAGQTAAGLRDQLRGPARPGGGGAVELDI